MSSRAGTVLGAAALAAALAVAAVAPMADGDRPAALDGTAETVHLAESGAESVAYAPPVPGAVVREFDEPDVPWGAGHRGVDLAAAAGEPVHAAADGVVAFVGVVVDRPVISIDHPDGIRTTYEPVAAVVAAGDAVVQGQVIGTVVVDGSHCAPAACLHWGARIEDDYIDPLSLLNDAVIRLYPVEGSAGPRDVGAA